MGRVVRSHGLSGEIVVELFTDRPSHLVRGSVFSTDRGPLRVEASRPHRDRYLVRFAGVATREDADSWRGVALRAEPLDEPGTLWVHELMGAQVVTAAGVPLGAVTGVEANPSSDLLVCASGALVPLRFVTALEPGISVTVDVPDGLVD
ncbi:MAG: ribosome maturation factor RimM [Acidimicrobiales bacterium]